jgi:hypothetical protein
MIELARYERPGHAGRPATRHGAIFFVDRDHIKM